MVRLFTAAQMRLADRLAAEVGVPGLELMENAGKAVAGLAAYAARAASGPMAAGGDPPAPLITILAGRGNNGGDGLVAARHLARQGFTVEVVLTDPGEAFTGDALVNYRVLTEAGSIRLRVFGAGLDAPGLTDLLARSAVVVDALLGTGAKGAPREPAATIIGLLNDVAAATAGGGRPFVLAVDLPSGLDADTGRAAGPCVRAGATITLGGVKVGLVLPEARRYVGRLHLAAIGLPESCLGQALAAPAGAGPSSGGGAPPLRWLLPEEAAALLPSRPEAGHKGTFGHVWVVAGSPGFTGAAVLAGLGALRSGAGLATVACPEGCRPVVAAQVPELLTRGLPEGPDGRLAAAGALDVASGTGSAFVVGPGLGATEEVRAFVQTLLGGRPAGPSDPRVARPTVLDADALNALSLAGPGGVTRFLRGAAAARPAGQPLVLTPHPGEMARLTGRAVGEVQADRIGVAREFAGAWSAVVVLKGAGTVVAAPDGTTWINATGNPGMATGGSGDVLAGAIGGFLAQGLGAVEAALLGVSVHGLAGDLAAREVGTRGLLATDFAHRLPRAMDSLATAGYGPLPAG